jgi:hypothetical protein
MQDDDSGGRGSEQKGVDRRQFLSATAGGAVLFDVLGRGSRARTATTDIADWHDLAAIRSRPGGEYQLVADLDQETTGYDEHVRSPDGGWEPIGSADEPFAGTVAGSGHEVSGLRIDRGSRSNVGLFGLNERSITDTSVVGCDVVGRRSVGGLVGTNTGTVRGCSATGTVEGTGPDAGGLVGLSVGDVAASTADCTVTGTRGVGGLVGNLDEGTVTDSSARGSIEGENGVGGLVGRCIGFVENSHYNIESVEINGDHILTIGGLFAAQYEDWVENDRELDLADYDSLSTDSGWIEIGDLRAMRDALGFMQQPERMWRLTADIDASEAERSLYFPYLTGNFDGNGHTVTVDIDLPAVDGIGLVGLNFGGRVKAVHVAGAVSGFAFVGGVVGENFGNIRETAASVETNGRWDVGGIVGANEITLKTSTASGPVDGETGVGGAVGSEYGGILRNVSASGDVTGDSQVGGLVGRIDTGGTVERSFASGAVVGSQAVGGVVGANDTARSDRIENLYWDRESTGVTVGVGEDAGDASVMGLETEEMVGESASEQMAALDFDSMWSVVTDPPGYPVLQWRTASGGAEENTDDSGAGFGLGGALAAVGGAGYLLKRRARTGRSP